MDTFPRGLLLIINNHEFQCDLPNREGTNVDRDGLQSLFLNFGFGVEVRDNLKALVCLAPEKL